MSTITLLFSHHICHCAVEKLKFSSDVNMFVKHVMNDITKKYLISAKLQNCDEIKSLFKVDINPGVYTK